MSQDQGNSIGQQLQQPQNQLLSLKQQQPPLQLYSCARCRLLKKKCGKQTPRCINCAKSSSACTYPGRAPRRSKKELERLRREGGGDASLRDTKRVRAQPKSRRQSSDNGNASGHEAKESSIDHLEATPVSRNSTLSPLLSPYSDNIKRLPLLHVAQANIKSDISRDNSKSVINGCENQPRSPSTGYLSSKNYRSHSPNFVRFDNNNSTGLNVLAMATTTSNPLNRAMRGLSVNGISGNFQQENSDTLNNNNISMPEPENSTENIIDVKMPGLQVYPDLLSNTAQTVPLPHLDPLTPNTMVAPQHIGSPAHDAATIAMGQLQATSIPNSLPGETPSFASAPNMNFKNSESLRPGNVPSPLPKLEYSTDVTIDESSIAYEVLKNSFKGGRSTTLMREDGSYKTIERALLDRFIAAYFKHNHRLFPMIDKIAFLNRVAVLRSFDDIANAGFDDTFIFQLFMIMAIGCTTLQRAGMLSDNEGNISEHLAFLAMKKFKSVIHLQDIDTVRCLLLLGIYSFFEPRGSSSWTISGVIMRLSIGLGLNRAIVRRKLDKMLPMEIENRNRVFWSAYNFERLVTTELGRLSCIADEEINIPQPKAFYEGEKEDIEVTNLIITLRRISGKIWNKVHSVAVSRLDLSSEDRQKIINDLRQELDNVYLLECENRKKRHRTSEPDENGSLKQEFIVVDSDALGALNIPDTDLEGIHDDFSLLAGKSLNATSEQQQQQQQQESSSTIGNNISFHSSDIWLSMRYAQLQILLHRPSALVPKPPLESLGVLGEFCLQALKNTYTLYKKKLLPLNWITLFRTLTICNTVLYCLCEWSIDLIESKIEIQQCVEILQHFGAKWVFAGKCADVFQQISNTVLDISLSLGQGGQVRDMDKLNKELFGASNTYQDILYENNVDISWADQGHTLSSHSNTPAL